jgi:hypothetical protein
VQFNFGIQANSDKGESENGGIFEEVNRVSQKGG